MIPDRRDAAGPLSESALCGGPDPDVVRLLRDPVDGAPLALVDGALQSAGGRRYALAGSRIACLLGPDVSEAGEIQRLHYDRVHAQYVTNLGYPHTQEYTRYLDRAFLDLIGDTDLGTSVDLCCGDARAIDLLGARAARLVAVDVSLKMLENAMAANPAATNVSFVQGDATAVPLADGVADSVVMLGGIHHVPDRARLFSEVARILKPGGIFLWREPVDDFLPWRLIRRVVYRVSDALDADTERPLRRAEIEPLLEGIGLRLKRWRTAGFFGFCLFMNSDVLVFNRAFRFLPGIRAITRASTVLDDAVLALPGMAGAGLIAVGRAEKAG